MEKAEIFGILKESVEAIQLDHPVRVAIDGVDGAGKTVFADSFTDYLRSMTTRQVIRSTIDKFHNPRHIRYERGPDSPEGYYRDSFNVDALIDCLLQPLGPGGSLRYRKASFDYMTDAKIEVQTELADKTAILIFDGIFLLRPELLTHWDFKIFLDVPFEVTAKRVLDRQKDKDYIGQKNDIERRYRVRYIPGQKLYLSEANPKEKADIIIDNSNPNNPLLSK